jgi:ribosomal protein S18 acetylase RimI-like enzyme
MSGEAQTELAILSAEEAAARLDELAALLHACVQAGASVNFVLPFGPADSLAFWRSKVLPALRAGGRVLWVARQGGRVVGSVQLHHDTPPNQPHRAEVTKLLVHPEFRRRGIARALMGELEREARRLGRSLITLDTRTGDSAEPLYASLGYRTVGIIPGYCRDTIEDRLDPTTIMYKVLD